MTPPRIPAAAWLTFAVAAQSFAQDVSVTPLAWVTRDPPEQLPVLRSELRPEFPRDLRNTPDFGYVALEIYVDEKGKSLGGRREATQPAYFKAVESALAGYQCQCDATFQQDFAFRLD